MGIEEDWDYCIEIYIDEYETLVQSIMINKEELKNLNDYRTIYRDINPNLELRFTDYYKKNGKFIKRVYENKE